ncbi:hypothetical protein AB990_20775 [Alkalihalobacillus pseudalcaliphilus]|nr:hypothetical protein AB990_20775 [Alkalihalobacillus pseudalcaliphilus]
MPLLLGLLALITFHSFVLYEKCTNQEACTNPSGGDGEADSCRRRGHAELTCDSKLAQRPPAESVPPIPGAIFKEVHISFSTLSYKNQNSL